jgi:hypothetical protein
MGDEETSRTRSVESVFTALTHYGLLLKQDKTLPSVVGILTGDSLHTSWWNHPKSHLIFSVLSELSEHPEVLITKILHRKDTLVHSSLWPALLAVACSRESWQMRGLSASAADLLQRIDRGESPVRATGPAVKELEIRLLATAHEVHTDSGRHEMVLESWQAWSARVKCKAFAPSARAREILEQAAANLGTSPTALPWRARNSA